VQQESHDQAGRRREVESLGDGAENRAGIPRVPEWADRTAELSRLNGVQQVYVFENRGPEIGVTLHHPHGQIYAFPYVPPKTRSLLAAISHYGPSLMQDILNFEREIAVLYPRILTALDRLYDTPTPYIAAWHQAPVHQGRADIRLMLQVTSPRRAKDKLKYTAGSETGMGAFIGDIVPETAAPAEGGAGWTPLTRPWLTPR
jgi:UDPglucose--hexose-1-phosphate uridylyltransferase